MELGSWDLKGIYQESKKAGKAGKAGICGSRFPAFKITVNE